MILCVFCFVILSPSLDRPGLFFQRSAAPNLFLLSGLRSKTKNGNRAIFKYKYETLRVESQRQAGAGNASDEVIEHPLIVAIQAKIASLIGHLINVWEDVDSRVATPGATQGMAALMLAIHTRQPHVVKLLLEANCEVNHTFDETI